MMIECPFSPAKFITPKTRIRIFSCCLRARPSAEFVASLPYGKIPDRNDFARLDVPTRFAYWREAVAQGQRLAEQLQEWIATDQIRNKVKLWTP